MERTMRVWWNPQVGCGATFYIPVTSVENARRVMDILSAYDCFQWNHKIKPDYCNCGGLENFDEENGEWQDWYFEDEGSYFEDVDEYLEVKSERIEALDIFRKALLGQVDFNM